MLANRTTAPAVVLLMAATIAVAGIGCGVPKGTRTGAKSSPLILATTTSTQDTGLLDELIPAFNKKYPQYKVKTIAVGSGEAIAMGARGDADVLLVHSKDDEEEFMSKSNGTSREAVMYNDFVIVGPSADPAKIAGSGGGEDAFAKIAAAKASFVTRGDKSGTHKKELKVWDKAGVKPSGAWYVSSGQGMGETLRIADQKDGYTLADRGTWLATKQTLRNTKLLVEGGKSLQNFYHVIVVSKKKFPRANEKGAIAFSDFLISAQGQRLIGEFGVEKFGQPLFVPDAGVK